MTTKNGVICSMLGCGAVLPLDVIGDAVEPSAGSEYTGRIYISNIEDGTSGVFPLADFAAGVAGAVWLCKRMYGNTVQGLSTKKAICAEVMTALRCSCPPWQEVERSGLC